MKAITVRKFGEPEVLEYGEVPDLQPSAEQILVKIEAAGVNPVDTYVRQGAHPSTPELPFTPGKDGAGTVAETGEAVTKIKKGERVYLAGALTGTYAEYALCSEDQVWRLPEKASFEQGAGIFVPYATAFRGLFQRAQAEPGESILIHGASGAVGIAAVQWAKNKNMKIYGTASSKKGLELVREQGADFVFDHSRAGYLQEIFEATGGKGIAVILEMLANENLQKDFEVLADFGRIVVIGNRGTLEFNPRLTMGKDASILGMSLFNASKKDFEEIHKEIFKGLSEGFLSPVVGKTFPLEEAYAAHVEVIESKAYGKIVLKP